MGWVFIDTTQAREFRFGLISSASFKVRTVHARSHSLLPKLSKNIGLVHLRKADGICVVHGPGSFSSVRGGVLVANLLARLLGKPLIGVERTEAEDLATLAHELESGTRPASSYVMPTYDAEPNITVCST